MTSHAFATLALTILIAQSQTPPSVVTPPTSPFAAAVIRQPSPTDGIGTPVGLTFAWPANLTATIDAERSKTTVTPDGRKTANNALRYRMRVTPHKDGRLVEYDSFEPTGVSLSAPEQSAVTEMLSSLMPSLVVDNTGAFVRVGDLTTIRAFIRQMTDTATKQMPAGAVPPNLQAMLDGLSSEAVLSQVAAEEWDTFVGAYVGFEGKVGEMAVIDSDEPSPLVPGLVVPMRTTFGATHRAPCETGRAPDSCVVMQIRSVVAPGGMQTIVKRLLEGMKGLEGVKYETFDVTTEVLTTIEPSTMRPYLVTRTRTAAFTVVVPGQGRGKVSTTDRRVYRITYPPR
jgi:hypothetical protein